MTPYQWIDVRGVGYTRTVTSAGFSVAKARGGLDKAARRLRAKKIPAVVRCDTQAGFTQCGLYVPINSITDARRMGHGLK